MNMGLAFYSSHSELNERTNEQTNSHNNNQKHQKEKEDWKKKDKTRMHNIWHANHNQLSKITLIKLVGACVRNPSQTAGKLLWRHRATSRHQWRHHSSLPQPLSYIVRSFRDICTHTLTTCRTPPGYTPHIHPSRRLGKYPYRLFLL